ncbi:LytTR family DNA-binding domain-containing protein [Poritiphilus flavus]|uniref:HTH LytTR-type domain-containing protein n=1 Tax=Poritiphilus flavus TaxID=2697053 RepID=A0A6L9EBH0_9FLAO|nr:LytTR family DNA-binding domain-containing protein [Poritiphilus flavus]NAS11952.1 hypothetical protein [Poritiphilus flavus]
MRTLGSKMKSIVFIRYFSMISLAFFITHYLSYRKLPFSDGYEFPLQSFAIVLIFGLFICELNAFIYRRLKDSYLGSMSLRQIILRQFALSAAGTAIMFSVLFIGINVLLIGRTFHPPSFFLYILMCIGIALFEDVLITAKDFYSMYQKSREKNFKHKGEVNKILVEHGEKTLEFEAGELAYLRSKNGVVTILDQNLKEYTTNFGSLSEIEEQLPSTEFFKINRQYYINRKVIKSIKKDNNRKLKVLLEKPYQGNESSEGLNVSRYKSVLFKRWYLSPELPPKAHK